MNSDVATIRLESLAGPVLESGLEMRFTAHGRSMFPFIRNGDVVVVEPCADRTLSRGDVVLVNAAGGQTVVHRIVSLSADSVTLLGDAQSWLCRQAFSRHQISGRVAAVERGSKVFRFKSAYMRLAGLAWMFFGRPLLPAISRNVIRLRGE